MNELPSSNNPQTVILSIEKVQKKKYGQQNQDAELRADLLVDSALGLQCVG